MGVFDCFSYVWGLFSWSVSRLWPRQRSSDLSPADPELASNLEAKWTLDQVKRALKVFRKCRLSTRPRYQYIPLEEREIRLLKISLPAARHQMLRFELERTLLDSAPPFQAISYCWGDATKPQDRVPITDSHHGGISWIEVTKSLSEMLAYLPRHCIPSGDASSYIWIDQLCINQKDENSSDKTHQIKLMGEIYSRATQVLIWLGPGPTPAAATSISKINTITMSPLSDEDITAIKYVWENKWFKRTWVVQESCLAQKRQVSAGLHPVHIEKQLAMQSIMNSIPSRKIEVDMSAVAHHLAAVKMWKSFEQISGRREESRGILWCSFLERFGQHLDLWDPKDMVLAFMSLWKPESFDIATTSDESHVQLYTRLARSLVRDTKRLDILAALRTGPLPGDTSRPSWVPTWNETRQPNQPNSLSPPSPLMAAYYSGTTISPLSTSRFVSSPRSSPDEAKPLQTPSTIQWKASGEYFEHEHVSQEDPRDGTLRTRGKIICTIKRVFPIITDSPLPEHAIERFQSSLHSNGSSIRILKALDILIECTEMGRPDEFADRGPLGEFRRLIRSKVTPDKTVRVSQDEIDHIEAFHGLSIPLFDSSGRRFLTATWSEGPEELQTMIGLGPGWTETGDDVAILHGARFPVILRKYGSEAHTYQVVGDCCIPEIMGGKAVYWAKAEADHISLA